MILGELQLTIPVYLSRMDDRSGLTIPVPTEHDELPFYFDFPGSPPLKACLDLFQEHHRPSVNNMWKDVLARGDGFGEGEDFSNVEDAIIAKHNPRYMGHVVLNVTNNEVMAVSYRFPSGMCRSEDPLYSGGHIIVNRAYRGRRISAYMTETSKVLAAKQYEGILGRVVVIGNNIKPAIVSILFSPNIVPHCQRIPFLPGQC